MHKKYGFRSAIALLMSATILVPASAFAQAGFIDNYLKGIAKKELPSGYVRPSNVVPRTGVLVSGNQVELSYKLRGGKKYGFVAVCDNCNDIDLRLVNANNGQIVENDEEEDEYGVVAYNPPANGVYDLQVIMFDCPQAECTYGIGVYRK